jgi:hypothetical protein
MNKAVLCLLIAATAAMSATVEIRNGTDLELYFIWITEAGRDKWVDMLGMTVLRPDSSLVFTVTRGWYDFKIQDSDWHDYTLERVPLSESNHFIWVVEPIHRSNP